MFSQPPAMPRSPLVAVVSLVLHGSLAAAVVVIGTQRMFAPHVDESRPLAYLTFAPPHPPVEVPTAALPAPVKKLEVPKAVAEAVPIVTPAPIEPAPVPEPVAPPPPKVMAAIVPRKPPVVLGAFANTAAAPVVEAKRTIQTAGFDTQTAAAPDMKLKTTAVGAFDAQPAAIARPGTDRAGVVPVGFEGASGAQPQQQNAPRAVVSTGFGTTAAATPVAPRGEIKPTGFGDLQPPTAAVAPARPKPDPTSQVEVIYKPKPAYTDEARARRIEGEVVLEVDFTAASDVRVIRVVRGLGYGLDEMATQAAREIRFKPAQSGGKPVDVRATVTIVFRLA